MDLILRWRAAAAATFAAAGALVLSACIVSPGTFDATLDLRSDGRFTFSYEGQIYLLALSRLAEMSAPGADEFAETPCHDDDSFEERPCTEAELAEQRRNWEEQAEARKQQAEKEGEQMRQLLGGIDPADPAAAEELAARLRRQEGWRKVEYRGDGLFEVEFSLSSRFGHDFTFPTLERFPMSNAFVIANVRQGNSVRIEAPGFAAPGGGSPFQGLASGMANALPAETAEDREPAAPVPEMAGTFRIVTDGRIMANNTDEGPSDSAAGQVLEWKVNARTQSPPMALVQLGG